MASEIESLVTRYKHFLAHASHVLGSPLTRVNIALGLARKKADPALQPELNRIGHETKRLNTLVQELLFLARLESGNELSWQTTSFDAALMIEEACADASFEAAQVGKSVVLQKTEALQLRGIVSCCAGHSTISFATVCGLHAKRDRCGWMSPIARIKVSASSPYGMTDPGLLLSRKR